MRKVIINAIVGAALVGGLALAGAAPTQAATEHCPDHQGNPGKVEGANNTTVLPAGTEFCVKGSTGATGKLIADGETTLFEYLAEKVDNGGGQDPDVSYYIVYAPPTTTEPPVTTATTEPPVTTASTTATTAPASEQAPPNSVASAGPVPPAAAPPAAAPPAAAPAAAPTALPSTGSSSWGLALTALASLMGGLGLVKLSRRPG